MRRILHHNPIPNPKPFNVAGWSKFGNKTGETDYPAVIRVSDPKMSFEWYNAPFHLERDGCKLLLVAPAKAQGAMSVRELIITTQEDWTQMIAKHIRWFDGDTILGVGGLDSLATHPHHTLVVVA